MTYVLYAVKEGEPDYKEEYITETESQNILSMAKVWALQNGYAKVRVVEYKDIIEPPDFVSTINKNIRH